MCKIQMMPKSKDIPNFGQSLQHHQLSTNEDPTETELQSFTTARDGSGHLQQQQQMTLLAASVSPTYTTEYEQQLPCQIQDGLVLPDSSAFLIQASVQQWQLHQDQQHLSQATAQAPSCAEQQHQQLQRLQAQPQSSELEEQQQQQAAQSATQGFIYSTTQRSLSLQQPRQHHDLADPSRQENHGPAYNAAPQQHHQQLEQPCDETLPIQDQVQQHDHEQLQPVRCTLFFAKVPRSAHAAEIRELFSTYGDVVMLDLFAEYPGAPSSKGCGLVVFADRAAATAAMDGLNNQYTWQGMRSPMVVKLISCNSRSQQQQMDPATNLAQRGAGHHLHTQERENRTTYGATALDPSTRLQVAASSSVAAVRERPDVVPRGCAADAYKLFVGNLPKNCTERELRQVLETVGPVVELVLLRDKVTHESKGSAFVWYATAAFADRAVQQLNLQVMLPSTEQVARSSRPLVVRRAASAAQRTADAAVTHSQQQQQAFPQQQQMWHTSGPLAAVQPQQQQQYYLTPSGAAIRAAAVGLQSTAFPPVAGLANSYTAAPVPVAALGSSTASTISATGSQPPTSYQLMQLMQQQPWVASAPSVVPPGAAVAHVGVADSSHASYAVQQDGSVLLQQRMQQMQQQLSPTVDVRRDAAAVRQLMLASEPGGAGRACSVQQQHQAAGVRLWPAATQPLICTTQQQPQQVCVVPVQQQPVQYVLQQQQQVQVQMAQQASPVSPVYVTIQQQPQQQQQQQWQSTSFPQHPRQPSAYHAELCFPETSIGMVNVLQTGLMSLPFQPGAAVDAPFALPSSMLPGASSGQQQQQRQALVATAAAEESVPVAAGLLQAPSMSTALGNPVAADSYGAGLAGPTSVGRSSLADAGINSGLMNSVPGQVDTANRPGGSELVNMSILLMLKVPLAQCASLLSEQFAKASMLSGASVKLLVGHSHAGGENFVVNIAGSHSQVATAYSCVRSVVQQCGLADVGQVQYNVVGQN